MKFKSTDNVNLRKEPRVDSPKLVVIPAGTIVESDEHAWKAVTLPDGTKGFCSAKYLEEVKESEATTKWHVPIREDKFIVTQKFLNPDPVTYVKTGVHPGVDYGTQGENDVPLFFCADGEVIEAGANHKFFGNYFFYYIPEVDRTFVYFHLRDNPPVKGTYRDGEQCGITGKTGLSFGIHLHLECIKGRKNSTDRAKLYVSRESISTCAEDADAFIRARLSTA